MITVLSANTLIKELCSYDINYKWTSFNLLAQACLIPLQYSSKQIYSIYLYRPDNVRTPTEKGDLWWCRAVIQEKQFLIGCHYVSLSPWVFVEVGLHWLGSCLGRAPAWVGPYSESTTSAVPGEWWLAQCKQLSAPAKQWCQSTDECYCNVRPSQYLETSVSRFTTVPLPNWVQ